jgi:hypothetical protein
MSNNHPLRPGREIAFVLVRFNHVASFMVNADDSRVRVGVSLRVTDSSGSVQEPPSASQRQYPRDEIEAPVEFRWSDFVNKWLA